jgi:1-acyl-sn-glycerol-3-phosphate acyltransferase
MRFFDFIFLKRKLALDQDNITSNLERSKKNDQPMWLVLFPEGTGKWMKEVNTMVLKVLM